MKKLNALAIKTFDKLLALSDEELKAKFDALNSSDLSEILSQSGMFESAKVESDIVYGSSAYTADINAGLAAFISQNETVEEICAKVMSDLPYVPTLNELWNAEPLWITAPVLGLQNAWPSLPIFSPTLTIPTMNFTTMSFPTWNTPTMNIPNVLDASTILNTNFDGLWDGNIEVEEYVSSNELELELELKLELQSVATDYKQAA